MVLSLSACCWARLTRGEEGAGVEGISAGVEPTVELAPLPPLRLLKGFGTIGAYGLSGC